METPVHGVGHGNSAVGTRPLGSAIPLIATAGMGRGLGATAYRGVFWFIHSFSAVRSTKHPPPHDTDCMKLLQTLKVSRTYKELIA